jgi:hypothetical protein
VNTIVEFRLVCGPTAAHDQCLGRGLLPAVPAPGELVSVNGAPYVVHERSWALEVDFASTVARTLYCYLRVCSLQTSASVAP